jgi:2-polyprenyl-3-methyl-5-hydroxy-6-metoxy-1,4-benzoquinol methylase
MYQDIWINGKLIKKGERNCEDRYNIIKEFCKNNYEKNKFSVCDIGANMCYFGIRLTEDFNNCNIIAYEYNNYKIREVHIEKNKCMRLSLFNKKINLNDIKNLNQSSHYNIVLALSVLHHVVGSIKEWIEELKKLADNIIIELAIEDSKRTLKCKDYELPKDSIILGYGISHLDKNVLRPIILLKGNI